MAVDVTGSAESQNIESRRQELLLKIGPKSHHVAALFVVLGFSNPSILPSMLCRECLSLNMSMAHTWP